MRFLAAYQCKQCAAVSSMVFEHPSSEDRNVAVGEAYGDVLRLHVEAQAQTQCAYCERKEQVYLISWNGLLYGVGTKKDVDRMKKALLESSSTPLEVFLSAKNICRLCYEGVIPYIPAKPKTIPKDLSGLGPSKHRMEMECAASKVIPQIEKRRMR